MKIKRAIDKLVNSLGEQEPPSPAAIKGQLIKIGLAVEELENQTSFSDLSDENEALKTEIKVLRTELDRLKKEAAEREQKDADLHPKQFEILKLLPAPTTGSLNIIEIRSHMPQIPEDELVEHLTQLENREYAKKHFEGLPSQYRRPFPRVESRWSRSELGNQLVIAKRLAGEEKTVKKFPDLPELEEKILATLIGEEDGVQEELIHHQLERAGEQITLAKVKRILLKSLKLKGFANYDEEEATYGTGNTWFIDDAGEEYFDERGKL